MLGVGDHQAAAPDLKRIGVQIEPGLQRVVHALDRGQIGAARMRIAVLVQAFDEVRSPMVSRQHHQGAAGNLGQPVQERAQGRVQP